MRRVLVDLDLSGVDAPAWFHVERVERGVWNAWKQDETTLVYAREPNNPEEGHLGRLLCFDLDNPLILEVE